MFKKYVALFLIVIVAVGLMVAVSTTGAQAPGLVGTWKVTIPAPDGTIAFEALQTFHADGTFTETSSLLGQKEEGPAHGAWSQDGDHYNLKFMLFAFDKETGLSNGMIQVKLQIKLDGADNWSAQTGSVNFIAPDGSMEVLDDGGSDSPTITATRIKADPA
jgi:hypothetical protein